MNTLNTIPTFDAEVQNREAEATAARVSECEATAARHRAALADLTSSPDYEASESGVSAWCHRLSAELAERSASIARHGGKAVFAAIFDAATGERIAAKIIPTRYGSCWACLDEEHKIAGVFFPLAPFNEARLVPEDAAFDEERAAHQKSYERALARYVKRHGVRPGFEVAPAYAKIEASGTGLSGLASAMVVTRRADEGWVCGAPFAATEEEAWLQAAWQHRDGQQSTAPEGAESAHDSPGQSEVTG